MRNLAFVIDYELQSAYTNFSLQSDVTYLIADTVNMHGVTAIEGGVIIKFSKTNTAQINFANGGPVWATSRYRNAIFTSIDDNTVGAPIGSGTPSGFYGGNYLNFTGVDPHTPSHFRISYAAVGMLATIYNPVIRHGQFTHCQKGIQFGSASIAQLTLENVLFYDVLTVHAGDANVTANHLTLHRCGIFSDSTESRLATLGNSMAVHLTNFGPGIPAKQFNHEGSDSGVFQTVGGGAHYLANHSPYRNAGSSSLNSPALSKDLKACTTYPPIVLSGLVSTDTHLSPQAQRDDDVPDLGYHYSCLDVVWSSVIHSNAVMTIAPGTAVGITASPNGYAFAQYEASTLVASGNATNLVHIVRHDTVQELANTNWVNTGPAILPAKWSTASANTVRAGFTEWTALASGGSHIVGGIGNPAVLDLSNCQIFGGGISISRPLLTMTNCLLHRVATYVEDNYGQFEVGLKVINCTFAGGALDLFHLGADDWEFRNTLFAASTNDVVNFAVIQANHNGYTTNVTRIDPGANDVQLAVQKIDFQSIGSDRHYLPTNGLAASLLNAGSTWATNLGLFHFTTTTNQWAETNSIVDIGFHYVARSSSAISALPVDTDGDGLQDYLENVIGTGSVEPTETDWQQTDSDGDGVSDYLEMLLGRNPLLAGTTNDATGALNLRRYTPLK